MHLVPAPDFILRLRHKIGTDPLWLIGATAVVLKGDQILLVQRADNGAWTPVTGIVDPGEHPAHTAAREVLEETGVRCQVESLARLSVSDPVVYSNGDRAQYLDHTFRCRHLEGEPYVADDESIDARWFAVADLPPMDPDVRTRIDHALRPSGPVELG